MKYQVLARKFRPQVFEEVVGQKPIVKTLQNAIQLDRIGHAYLFCGPRGVGKTTTARILAKGLNCLQGPTITPCNQCPSCMEISAGQSMDVLEIDAASNTGVDNIRELRESARYAPSRDRYKIFIIDEVHMLSTSAFNALLKILEEPPSHVAFIMATTERHKLPATILSRCQQFVFRTISAAEILQHLKQIADREGVRIDDAALSYIVKASEGSMRDAQSLLDQIISFSGQEVLRDDVRNVLGFIPNEILDNTIDALAERNSVGLVVAVGIVTDQGLNLQQYVREFIGRIRDLLLTKLGLHEKILGSSDEKRDLDAKARRFSEQDLIRFFDMLLRLENDMRHTAQPRFHLEVGFIKMARVGYVRDIEEVIRDMKDGPNSNSVTRTSLSPSSSPARPSASLPTTPPSKPVDSGPGSTTFADVFRNRVEKKSTATAVHLEKADRIDKTEAGIQILMTNPNGFSVLDNKEHRRILDEVGGELVGKPNSVSLIMKEPPAQAERPAQSDPAQTIESAREEPLVKRFLEVFRGDLAQVKPAKGE